VASDFYFLPRIIPGHVDKAGGPYAPYCGSEMPETVIKQSYIIVIIINQLNPTSDAISNLKHSGMSQIQCTAYLEIGEVARAPIDVFCPTNIENSRLLDSC